MNRKLISRTAAALGVLAVPIALHAATSQAAGEAQQEKPQASISDRPSPTPATIAIQTAKEALQDGSPTAEEYLALATAYSRRARETADPEWYDRSDAELAKALAIMPGDFASQRMQVWNQLGRHEFQDAYKAALKLNLRAKDDVLTYGLIVDAAMEIGRYEEAENAAQWMLNLRPGTPIAMTRVSYLREQFGDLPGAIEAMRAAFHSTRPSDAEDAAWILTHLAHLELERGDTEKAKNYADAALVHFPEYHYALGELGEIHGATGDQVAALDALTQRYEVAPHPENLYHVAVATEAAGNPDQARGMFEEFETAALAESQNVDNANLELIEYWSEHVGTEQAIAKALALSRARAEERSDIPTLHALAWTQHKSGDSEEAWATIRRALEVGTVDAKLRFHAGEIAEAAGHADLAEEQYQTAMQTSPQSKFGRLALDALKRLPEGDSAE